MVEPKADQSQEEFWKDKIHGAWMGKIIGGTYVTPVEGKIKKKIQKIVPPLSGWTGKHHQIANDDEQYEFIALLALESCSDEDLQQKWKNHELLSPDHQGPLWEQNLHPRLVFTAEKAALENAMKNQVPWKHAADEVYNNKYQNPYFDWIGAQMKGELFGMLAPAWGWHADPNPTWEKDRERLAKVIELAFQDGSLAHRGVGIVGEIFVATMIAIGIDYDPLHQEILIHYPRPALRILEKTLLPNLHLPESKSEKIRQIGLTAEVLKEDLRRLEQVLINCPLIEKKDVGSYFRFITPIIEEHDQNSDPRAWEEIWNKIDTDWHKYIKELESDAKSRLSANPSWVKERKNVIKRHAWVHTLGNNAVIAIGLIYGDGDFSETVIKASECGYDADCNAGNAAAILGAYLGNQLIPFYMKRFIRGEVIPILKNYTDQSILNLALRSYIQAKRISKLSKPKQN